MVEKYLVCFFRLACVLPGHSLQPIHPTMACFSLLHVSRTGNFSVTCCDIVKLQLPWGPPGGKMERKKTAKMNGQIFVICGLRKVEKII